MFLCRYEEEKDLQSGEMHLLHWNKMCQEPRVSDQKTSRVWAKIQMVKLSRNYQQVAGCSQLEGPSSEALPHVFCTVQEEDDSLGHSRKGF